MSAPLSLSLTEGLTMTFMVYEIAPEDSFLALPAIDSSLERFNSADAARREMHRLQQKHPMTKYIVMLFPVVVTV